jgi:osmotically-inducible protein OsmY
MKKLMTISFLSLALVGCTDNSHSKTTKPSETNINGTETRVNGLEAEGDRAISLEVQRKLNEKATLSAAAKNVRITTVNGVVTLRGTVENNDEKAQVEELVKSLRGVTKVDNQLEIKK